MYSRRIHVSLIMLAALAPACALELDDDPDDLDAGVESDDPGAQEYGIGEMFVDYNEVWTKSIHNSYERYESLLDQLTYHRVRSVEFDIIPDMSDEDSVQVGGRWYTPCELAGRDCEQRSDDWFVYHEKPYIDDDLYTTCYRLSDCLDQLRTFHQMKPLHSVITVFIDLKRDVFGSTTTNTPDDLDNRIKAHLDESWLVTPGDLIEDCTGSRYLGHLNNSIRGECSWPSLWSLRGKFMIVLTGSEDRMRTYTDDGELTHLRAAFVSKNNLDGPFDDYVFYNLKDHQIGDAIIAHDAHYVTRMYRSDGVWGWDTGGLNDLGQWNDALAAFVNFPATDRVNAHKHPQFSSVNGFYGYPMTCLADADCSTEYFEESDDSFTIDASIDGNLGEDSSDELAFLSTYVSESNYSMIWDAHIGNANAYMADDAAAGCLMLRYSLSNQAPYAAICRRGDKGGVYASWRGSWGATPSVVDAPRLVDVNGTPDGVQPLDAAQDGIGHVRLVHYPGSRSTVAYVSRNGSSWERIVTMYTSGPLSYQGVALSSLGSSGNTYAAPGNGRIAARFSNVRRRVWDASYVETETAFTSPNQLGYKVTFGPVGHFECRLQDEANNLCASYYELP